MASSTRRALLLSSSRIVDFTLFNHRDGALNAQNPDEIHAKVRIIHY